jgi:hypothetical protein
MTLSCDVQRKCIMQLLGPVAQGRGIQHCHGAAGFRAV